MTVSLYIFQFIHISSKISHVLFIWYPSDNQNIFEGEDQYDGVVGQYSKEEVFLFILENAICQSRWARLKRRSFSFILRKCLMPESWGTTQQKKFWNVTRISFIFRDYNLSHTDIRLCHWITCWSYLKFWSLRLKLFITDRQLTWNLIHIWWLSIW